MKAKLNYKGKEIEIPDIIKVNSFEKFTGLMFKNKETNALLFEFDKPTNQAIHSLFCPDFLAIWLNENRIIDYKVVTSAKLKIKPQENFNKLLEIPLNNRYFPVVEFFLEKEKI